MKNALRALLVGMGLAVMLPSAWAQAGGTIESQLAVQRVVAQPDGRTTLAPAASAKPGDVLEYVATYRNVGGSAVTRLQPTLPIPAGTEVLPESIRSAGLTASLDGRKFEPVPLKRLVRQPDGRSVEQPVPLAEYRALRWPAIDLAAGKDARFTARVRLSTDAAAKPAN